MSASDRRWRRAPVAARWWVLIIAAAGVGAALLLLARTDPGPPAATTPQSGAVSPAGPGVDVAFTGGGFEGATLADDGWRVDGASAGARAATTRVAVRSGRQALRITVSADAVRLAAVRSAIPVASGLTCTAGGYALGAAGDQSVVLRFRAQDGSLLASRSTPAAPSAAVWSRQSVTADSPAGTATADVIVLGASGSSATWDDVDLSCPHVPDGGFESPGRAGIPTAWDVTAPPGTGVHRSDLAHTGRASLEVVDSSRGARATVRSRPVDVTPGLELSVSGAVLPVVGRQEVAVLFWDGATSSPVRRVRVPVAEQPPGTWRTWDQTVSVPSTARSASVEIASDDASTSRVLWDDLALSAAPPKPVTPGAPTRVATLDDYLNTASSTVVDVGGRPKLLAVVSGAPAQLQVADLGTGRVEDTHELTHLTNGWAFAKGGGSLVYLGGGEGHLLRYDVASHTLTDLGRVTPRAQIIFSLATGPDGRIWGGSYPGGELWSYDPIAQRTTAIAPVGGGREYARSLVADSTTLYVGTGSVRPDILRVDLRDPSRRSTIALPTGGRTGIVMEVGVHGRILSAKLPDGSRGFYDLSARTWSTPLGLDSAGRPLQQTPTAAQAGPSYYYFAGGRLWRVDPTRPDATAREALALSPVPPGRTRFVLHTSVGGVTADWLLSYDGARGVVAINLSSLAQARPAAAPSRVPWSSLTVALQPRPLRIKSLGLGSGGELYAGGFGGTSLSAFDAGSPYPALVPQVGNGRATPAGFGEVEGLVANGPFQYFGSYTSARIFRLDSRKPWVDGDNPRLLATLGPAYEQDRPIAWAVSGTRTFFGTIPRYGVLGGVLGWFEGEGTTPRVVRDPVPGQSVVALAARGDVVYGGTSRWGGLGATPTSGSAAVFAYDAARGRMMWSATPRVGEQALSSVLVDGAGRLWAASRSELFELDRSSGQVVRTFPLGLAPSPAQPTYAVTGLVESHGRLVVASGGGLWALDPGTGAVTAVASRGVWPSKVQTTGDWVYFPSGTALVRARL